jgi:hypothetical protein
MLMLSELAALAQRNADIDVNLTLNGIVALLAGILILIMPRLLNYIVAIYLIFIGVVEIFDIRI